MKLKLIGTAVAVGAFVFGSASGWATTLQWTVASGGNGDYYTYVHSDLSTWDGAHNAALAAGGYLATITSAAENTFVLNLIDTDPDIRGAWLGGTADGAHDYWRWVDGPEAGQSFYSASSGPTDFSYANWNAGEPNNAFNQEFSLMMYNDGTWNDLNSIDDANPNYQGASGPTNYVNGYVIESAVAPTPIPAALPLFASALGGLGFIGWRQRKAVTA